MQHIIINWDATNKRLSVDPPKANLWRDDQSIMWSFGSSSDGLSWASSTGAVFFPEPPPQAPWPGSPPAPIGVVNPGGVDRRQYVANGGSPNLGTEPVTYKYDFLLNLPNGDVVKLSEYAQSSPGLEEVLIDPEILNQPQP